MSEGVVGANASEYCLQPKTHVVENALLRYLSSTGRVPIDIFNRSVAKNTICKIGANRADI